jgi:hypothetical protein
MRRVTIAQHERGLKFRNRSFKTVLEPGVYRIFDPLSRTEVQVYDLTVPEFDHPRVDFLIKEARATMERYFTIVELGDREVGVVYKNGRVAGLVAPGKRQLYWRGPIEVSVQKCDIAKEFELPKELAKVLVHAKQPLAAEVADSVTATDVPDTSIGLLIVDGELVRVLEPGMHAFWKYQRALKVELVDRRVQAIEAAGQEILTRDKVSLRVNLTALWQVLDVVKARAGLSNFAEFVYKELQCALREAVGTRTLDELLGDKGVLDRDIWDAVRVKVEEHGLAVRSVGVMDVILPGEMKTILNHVAEAETDLVDCESQTVKARPFNVGVSFHHDFYDLGEAVFKTRAIQAFEGAATRYPIHRLVRCAVQRPLEDVFDDLALNIGLAAQRMARGSLLLDGPGVFVHAEGSHKASYCSCTFNLWAGTKTLAEETCSALLRIVGERHLPEQMFVVEWHFSNARGTLLKCSLEEVAQDVVFDEAYPTLGEPAHQFVARYLRASETVLIVQGPPGSGKTRLVRSILAAMSHRKHDSAEVMYTADRRALENDEIFVDFITGSHDAFVIEDADHLLMARTNGNHDLHRFLMIADGVVCAQGRKIIFTTNLPNIKDLDEALLRPGRCFSVVRTRALNGEEIARLVARTCGNDAEWQQAAHNWLNDAGTRSASVAQIYRACTATREGHVQVGRTGA